MVDVGEKPATARRAQAQGRIEMSTEAMRALVERKNPKGNVLALAESAGIMAAKNVAQLLPLCHPLPIEQVRIFFEIEESRSSVLVVCEVAVTAKTGAEMEALAGVNGALLCIYDLCKAVDPVLKITDIRLNLKSGGKSGDWSHPEFSKFKAGSVSNLNSHAAASLKPFAGSPIAVVLTVSDRVASGTADDQSGPLLAQILHEAGIEVLDRVVVADDLEEIKKSYLKIALQSRVDLIISTGGTGLSLRDVTPEALHGVCDRMIPGFGELLRANGAQHIPTAWLSRSTAGILRGKLLIALPGSPKAVREGLEALLPILPHALHTLKGGDHAVR